LDEVHDRGGAILFATDSRNHFTLFLELSWWEKMTPLLTWINLFNGPKTEA